MPNAAKQRSSCPIPMHHLKKVKERADMDLPGIVKLENE
jgi:hypothetical protein